MLIAVAVSFSTTSRGPVRHKYKNPPIAEAVCEFRFKGSSEWDWTILGLVYQEIKAEFPKKRQEKAFEINIAHAQGRVEKGLGESLSKMQFLREDGSAMVQIGPDLLGVNILPPYPGWETFESLIQKQLAVYSKIAHPAGFNRIGLRFINKIGFPTRGIETTDYFNYYPRLPENLEQVHGPFSMRVFHLYEGERDTLSVHIGHAVPTGESLTILLDLDYYLTQPGKVELSAGLSWVRTAHERVESMFEACITDKTRAMFEEIK
jgi:uncharacterized protein (TIGR04255 family)